jgi:hypothetical protein
MVVILFKPKAGFTRLIYPETGNMSDAVRVISDERRKVLIKQKAQFVC